VIDVLGPDSEPQPDICLLIPSEKGGQTRINEQGYLEGAPELIAEIASSTESYDLHSKKRDYERGGVREYLVVALRQSRAIWFILRQGKFEELAADSDGILRSSVFPGLWLDPAALLRLDSARMLEVLRQGLATPEHAALVSGLAGK
jgi:Uma2 family endonuclease